MFARPAVKVAMQNYGGLCGFNPAIHHVML